MPEAKPGSIEVFFSYAHADERLRDELAKQLALLQRQGVITLWHDRAIAAGDEWKGALDERLESAGIILLLVSPDFLASDYCWDVEVQRAMARHAAGTARVIPVILRPCDWLSAPFGKLQALPKDARPVTSWSDRDEALLDVARGIRAAAQAQAARTASSSAAPASRSVAAPEHALAPADPSALNAVLVERFNLEELRVVCFELGVGWEDLPGDTRGAKARELIDYCRRRGRLADLIDTIRRGRPDIVL